MFACLPHLLRLFASHTSAYYAYLLYLLAGFKCAELERCRIESGPSPSNFHISYVVNYSQVFMIEVSFDSIGNEVASRAMPPIFLQHPLIQGTTGGSSSSSRPPPPIPIVPIRDSHRSQAKSKQAKLCQDINGKHMLVQTRQDLLKPLSR